MNNDVIKKTSQLSDFDDTFYKVIGNNEDNPSSLIATSE